MSFELDHIFICTAVGAPEAERLIEFGLAEGSPNTHPGQGTANRRFFFQNAMLELLWVANATEAQSAAGRTRLWERWTERDQDACPFGFCVRPKIAPAGELPFPAWEYRPRYLPPSVCMHIGTNSDVLSEPMLAYLGFIQPAERRQQLEREGRGAGGVMREITRTVMQMPGAKRASPELATMARSTSLELCEGQAYLLEIGFDGEKQGKLADFRPLLPLVFRW
jgi:hypothetical protein